MRCSTCKTCLSSIKEGHLECLKTFNYKKSKNALKTAARHKQREIYNFLKKAGCPRSFEDEIHSCVDHEWDIEFYSFFDYVESLGSCDFLRAWGRDPSGPTPSDQQINIIRHLVYATVRHNDIRWFWFRNVFKHLSFCARDAFADVVHLNSLFKKTIKSEHCYKIEFIYTFFGHRYKDWSLSHFEHAIATGDMSTLKWVIYMWKNSPIPIRSVANQMKLATIKNNRLDMLKMLDRSISGYPEDMMDQMRTYNRLEMITYVEGQENNE
jgi:hypothetical protein